MTRARSLISVALLALMTTVFGADAPPAAKLDLPQTQPSLTDAEKAAGWKLIFDGKTTTGLRGLGMDHFPSEAWEIKDGYLHCLGGAKVVDLITTDKHESFEMTWEWLIPKLKGNSGVKYRVQETEGQHSAFGCEYQLMLDPGVENKDATGSLYDVLPPTGKKLVPEGQFNQSRILVQGNHVEHWLNGVKVVEYEFWNDAFKEAVAKSKFAKSKVWAREPKAYIALQDHHDEIYFKNMKIRDISAK